MYEREIASPLVRPLASIGQSREGCYHAMFLTPRARRPFLHLTRLSPLPTGGEQRRVPSRGSPRAKSVSRQHDRAGARLIDPETSARARARARDERYEI